MKDYWSKRFADGGKVWGENPSLSAKQACALFASCKVESILVPGSGYGRHTIYFESQGFDAEGIEITDEGIKLARSVNPEIVYYNGSVLDMPFSAKKYDAIYCFNVLHLFTAEDRKNFVASCIDALKECGYIYFTSASEQEESYGRGAEMEENTFESKPGRPVHYFTEDDLRNSFAGFEILDTGIIDENENHGEAGLHVHKLRYIFARKL